MTMLLIVTQTAATEIFGSMLYLVTMVSQIAIFCWVGNEIIYAVILEVFRNVLQTNFLL